LRYRSGNRRECGGLEPFKRYPVTVYETELRAGGHSHTIIVD
jgi:hypothetical protein